MKKFLYTFKYTITFAVLSSAMFGMSDWRKGATVLIAGCAILLCGALCLRLFGPSKEERD